MKVRTILELAGHMVDLYWWHREGAHEYGRREEGLMLRWRGQWYFLPAGWRLHKIPFSRLLVCVGPGGWWPARLRNLAEYRSPQLVPVGSRQAYDLFDRLLDCLPDQEPWTDLRLWPAPKRLDCAQQIDFVDFSKSRPRIMRATV